MLVTSPFVSAAAHAATPSNLDVASLQRSIVNEGQWKAQSFTTDALAYLLDAVMIRADPAADASGDFFLSIYDDNGGLPGSELAGGLLAVPEPTTIFRAALVALAVRNGRRARLITASARC